MVDLTASALPPRTLATRASFPSPPAFAGELSPFGNPLGEVIHTMGLNAVRIYPDMTCLMDAPGDKCRFCGPLPPRRSDQASGRRLSDDQITDEIGLALKAAQAEIPADHIFMSTGA